MSLIKDQQILTANGTAYFVGNLNRGKQYMVGLNYESGTGTIALGFSTTSTGTFQPYYDDAATPAALTITATTPRGHVVRAQSNFIRINITSASSLVGTFSIVEIPHGG